MKTSRANKGINYNCFFYLSIVLVTFDIFPFFKYGLGSGKALSIIPLLIYVLGEIILTNKIVLDKSELYNLILTIAILFISFFKSNMYGCIDGFSQAFNMFIIYWVTYYAYRCFAVKASDDEYIMMFKMIICSFGISLVFGFIEFVNIFFVKSSNINNLLAYFLRDTQYLQGKRIQFNFGEPGSAGMMIVLLLFPTIFFLKKIGYKFSVYNKFKVLAIIILAFFSGSATYFLMIGMWFILMLFFNSKKNSLFKLLMFILGGGALVSGYLLINSSSFQMFIFSHNIRALKVLTSKSGLLNDASSLTRMGMIVTGINAFFKHPILGYGWGNFRYAFNENYMSVNTIYRTIEFLGKYDYNGLQSYSIYTTAAAEGGILGILWLLSSIKIRMKNRCKYFTPFLGVFFVQLFQSVYIYVVPLVLAFMILTDNRLSEIMERRERH